MDKVEYMGLLIFMSILFCAGIIGGIDGLFKYPQAAEKANQICQSQGYDFYEDFKRVGILSSTPVALKCMYVSNYIDIDLERIGNNLVTTKE